MRTVLYLGAAAMCGWIVTGTVLWFGQHGGPALAWTHLWSTLGSDWMLVVLLTDMLVFTIAAFVWVAVDLRARSAPPGHIAAWLVPMLFLGSAVLLLYLTRRQLRGGIVTAA